MDPTTTLETAKQAASGLLLIPVIWFCVKDLRRRLAASEERIKAIELARAADPAPHDIRHLKEQFAELDGEVNDLHVEAHDADKQLSAIWSKIGDRPEDKQRRGDR